MRDLIAVISGSFPGASGRIFGASDLTLEVFDWKLEVLDWKLEFPDRILEDLGLYCRNGPSANQTIRLQIFHNLSTNVLKLNYDS